jgi:glycerol uptake facilitator-like aquaporin
MNLCLGLSGFVCFYLVEKNILYLVKNFILLKYINHNNNPITNTMLNKYVVEFLGTLFFLYVIVATGNAIAIGAALAIAIMVGGSISGGHFNPAVTIMMYAAGKLSRSDLIPYLIVQIAGGLVALELYKRFKF